MNCFKCSEPLKTGAKFCNECGAKQEVLCPTCGKTLQPGETVCSDCLGNNGQTDPYHGMGQYQEPEILNLGKDLPPLHVNKFALDAQQAHDALESEKNPIPMELPPITVNTTPPPSANPIDLSQFTHLTAPTATKSAYLPPPPSPPVEYMMPSPPRVPVPEDACTEGDAKQRGFTFERTELGYRITSFNGRNNAPNIPAIIEGVRVIEVCREAFEGKGVESVTIPDGIQEIGDWCFTDNAMTKVDIPDSVQYIGLCAFKNNKISNVTLPRNLKKVDKEAFECNKLTHINLSQMLDYIGQSAFSYNNLTNVVIPGSVMHIGSHAFSYNQITSLIISPGVSFLGQDAFAYNQLASVSVPYGVTEISDAAFYMNKLSKIIIPSSVHTIGENAFRSNQLRTVAIPGSVMNIHPNAFDKWVEIVKI